MRALRLLPAALVCVHHRCHRARTCLASSSRFKPVSRRKLSAIELTTGIHSRRSINRWEFSVTITVGRLLSMSLRVAEAGLDATLSSGDGRHSSTPVPLTASFPRLSPSANPNKQVMLSSQCMICYIGLESLCHTVDRQSHLGC